MQQDAIYFFTQHIGAECHIKLPIKFFEIPKYQGCIA
jgi:hypothetical protein